MTASPARIWGQLVGAYARSIVTEPRIEVSKAEALPKGPLIWVGFHEDIMITMVAHRLLFGTPVVGLVPSGLSGEAMTGWFEALDITPVPMPERDTPRGTIGLMKALRSGSDVLLAVDGPDGPRRRVKPGALWLAAACGAPLIPVGAHATPAIRLPRWDRLVVPLPGARMSLRTEHPVWAGRGARSAARAGQLAHRLSRARSRAEWMLSGAIGQLMGEAT